MDAELARLVSVSKSIHRAPAPAGKAGSFTVPSFASLPSPKPSKVSKPPKPLPVQPTRKRKAPDVPAKAKAAAASEDASQGTKFARPPRAERDLFMSASASRIHERAAPEPERGVGKGIGSAAAVATEAQQRRIDFKEMAHNVEMFGGAQLQGLSRKDQKARERAQLGLQPEKPHKRPYKQLMELRKKQRAQDATAAELARQGGNTARKQTAELAGRGVSKVYGRLEAREGGSSRGPSDGVSAAGGVLNVSAKQIRAVAFHTKNKGKGKGGGGKGKGGRGGKGGGRGRGRGGGRR